MAQSFDINNNPHRRRNPLTGDWVLVSPHRSKRPWLGQLEPESTMAVVDYDNDCYLCPGNTRMNGAINPSYSSTYTFGNDFAALKPDTPTATINDEFFSVQSERGLSKVICFSPKHSTTLAELPITEIKQVIRCWIEQCEEIGQSHPWIQIFENKGATMGCSIPHPHCQIWAQDHAPTLVSREADRQADYYKRNSQPLLLDYAKRELALDERIVVENEDWLVLVPYWASWPFETLLLPKTHLSRFTELNETQHNSLADMLAKITIRYDNLFQCSFPYSMGWHSAPFDGSHHLEWQLHAHFYPPLLRSSNVRKFMVGYEMLAEAQRDMTAEQAAQLLKNLSNTHYKNNSVSTL